MVWLAISEDINIEKKYMITNEDIGGIISRARNMFPVKASRLWPSRWRLER